jgi:multimeric flavodoxin WrbA
MITISIISFSGRVQKGNCYEISLYLKKKLMNEFTDVHIFFLSESNIHNCSHCEYECFSEAGNCPYDLDDIKKIYNQIQKSDMSFFVIPIFSGFPCSNFFIFNERSQCFFSSNRQYDEYLKIPQKYIIIGNTGFSNAKNIICYDSIKKDNLNQNFLNICSKEVDEKSIKGNLIEYKSISDKIDIWLKQCLEEIRMKVRTI